MSDFNPDTQYRGSPCKRGHAGVRWRSNRNCVECNRARQRVENLTPEQHERKRARQHASDRKRYANNPAYRMRMRIRKMKADAHKQLEAARQRAEREYQNGN